jgi:CHASE3 domain sensor protein
MTMNNKRAVFEALSESYDRVYEFYAGQQVEARHLGGVLHDATADIQQRIIDAEDATSDTELAEALAAVQKSVLVVAALAAVMLAGTIHAEKSADEPLFEQGAALC